MTVLDNLTSRVLPAGRTEQPSVNCSADGYLQPVTTALVAGVERGQRLVYDLLNVLNWWVIYLPHVALIRVGAATGLPTLTTDRFDEFEQANALDASHYRNAGCVLVRLHWTWMRCARMLPGRGVAFYPDMDGNSRQHLA